MEKILQLVKAMDDVRAKLATCKSQHRELVALDKQTGTKSDQKDLDAQRAGLHEELGKIRVTLAKEFNRVLSTLSTKMSAEEFEDMVRKLAAVGAKESLSTSHLRAITRSRLGLPGKSKVERARARRNKALKAKEVK